MARYTGFRVEWTDGGDLKAVDVDADSAKAAARRVRESGENATMFSVFKHRAATPPEIIDLSEDSNADTK